MKVIKSLPLPNALFIFLFLACPLVGFSQQMEYPVDELMGKADIDLYGENINLRKEAYDAFISMRDAALKEGIQIQVVSSFRSFDRQAAIFEGKYERFTDVDGLQPLEAIDKIIEYSTIPGTSRHHWGTDVDLIDGAKPAEGDVLVAEKFGPGGPYEAFKNWMDENSEKYGFYLVYTDEPRRRGFKYEPWHYTYAPLSVPMLSTFRKKNILQLLEREDFLGVEHFTTGFIKTYITDNLLDINPDLL
ncbi:MAG: M15 family metallopeptidase [Eudoraea sp.]|nr:M15 family metallopeptidase [Eudoraea sp.]NNK30433.1 M15 family metallopeptidase [Flavobacteriaceae bacterium]